MGWSEPEVTLGVEARWKDFGDERRVDRAVDVRVQLSVSAVLVDDRRPRRSDRSDVQDQDAQLGVIIAVHVLGYRAQLVGVGTMDEADLVEPRAARRDAV